MDSEMGPLLDAKALGELLGVSTASVYRRRSFGDPPPPAIKFGRNVRWCLEDVRSWIWEHREVEGGARALTKSDGCQKRPAERESSKYRNGIGYVA